MNANVLADYLDDNVEAEFACEQVHITQAATMLRQQQNEIEDLKNANRFIQNFAEEQHQRAVALESELDMAVELYTDKAIENEALKELLANEGIVVGHDYLNDCIATMRKAQEK
jgi:hypothetical protein